MSNSKVTSLAQTSVPDLSDIMYTVDVSDTTDASSGSSKSLALYRLLGLLNHVAQGRLTGLTGVPFTVADLASISTIYFTPHGGNSISIYDGTRWKMYAFSELSLALSGLTTSTNYDVFVYDNAGTLTLKLGTAWTSNTARVSGSAGEIVKQDGVYVNKYTEGGMASLTGRYLGTIRATGATTTADSYGGASQAGGKRFVWNVNNRIRRDLSVIDTTNTWGYTTATWHAANAQSNNKVEYVVGLSEQAVEADVSAIAVNDTSPVNAHVGVGVDSTSANSAKITNGYGYSVGASGAALAPSAKYSGYPGIGYHALTWLEISEAAGSTTWFGDNGRTDQQSGMTAFVWG